jgi:hypothetical protein
MRGDSPDQDTKRWRDVSDRRWAVGFSTYLGGCCPVPFRSSTPSSPRAVWASCVNVTHQIDPGSLKPIGECRADVGGFAFSVADIETDETQDLRIVFDMNNWTVWLSNGFKATTCRRWVFPCCLSIPFPQMPSPLPRRNQSSLVARVARPAAAFPIGQTGRLLHCAFRGLLGVHSRCGLRVC